MYVYTDAQKQIKNIKDKYEKCMETHSTDKIIDRQCPPCPHCDIPNLQERREIIREIIPAIGYMGSEYRLVGNLQKEHNVKPDDPYKILPLYGKEMRGNMFKYYTEYVSGDQTFRILVSTRSGNTAYKELSREIYDGDRIHVDAPINETYIFREDRIERFDEDPFYHDHYSDQPIF